MIDEETNEDVTETPEAAEAKAPGAESAANAPAEDAPPADAAPEDVSAAEPPAGAQSADLAEPAAEEGPSEPDEQLPPKERRRRSRSAHSGEARPQRTAEERHADRLAKRAHNVAQRRRWRANGRKRRSGEPKREGGTPPAERAGTGSPRLRQGVVVSDKSNKTITVQIDVARQHRTYGKIVRKSSTLSAHDERNEANAGDTVRVVESRPLSRTKRWRLVEILERAR